MSNSMQRVYLGLALALATASWASAQEIPATTIPEQLPQSASQKRESAKPPSFSPGDPMPDREPKPDAAGKKGTDVRKIDEPEPLQQSPHNIDPEVLTDLNPIFLEVADAAILEDSSKLKRCAEKLDAFAEKSPAHRVAVGMAQLVICDLIPARESYISQSARICSWERLDPAQAENIALRFAMFRMQLLQSDHADWDPAVIRECQKHLWPGPDQLTAAISRAYVQLLDSYEEKAAFLQGMRDKAQQFTITINP